MREQIIAFNFTKAPCSDPSSGADRMEYPSAPFSRGAMIGGEADVGGSGAETGSVIYRGAGTWIRVGTRDYSGMWWKTYWPDFQSSLSSVDVCGRRREGSRNIYVVGVVQFPFLKGRPF